MKKTLRVRVKADHFVDVMVDDDDYEAFSSYAWRLFGAGYVGRKVYSHFKDGKSYYKMCYMHRLVTGAKEGQQVDHINQDKLDNRRSNLRLCSASENGCNKASQETRNGAPTTSSYKGVRRANPKTGMKSKVWIAEIRKDGRAHSLGYFATEIEAANAYNEAAKELHGEFASLNSVFSC